MITEPNIYPSPPRPDAVQSNYGNIVPGTTTPNPQTTKPTFKERLQDVAVRAANDAEALLQSRLAKENSKIGKNRVNRQLPQDPAGNFSFSGIGQNNLLIILLVVGVLAVVLFRR